MSAATVIGVITLIFDLTAGARDGFSVWRKPLDDLTGPHSGRESTSADGATPPRTLAEGTSGFVRLLISVSAKPAAGQARALFGQAEPSSIWTCQFNPNVTSTAA